MIRHATVPFLIVLGRLLGLLLFISPGEGSTQDGINLLQRYPTSLKDGITNPDEALPWIFTDKDIYRLSAFSLSCGDSLTIEIREAELGIGHCAEGAVWAIVMPRKEGELVNPAHPDPEAIDHIWLRFHPRNIGTLFPETTVNKNSDRSVYRRMQRIADTKLYSSFHAGNRVMIPEPSTLVIDADTKNGIRRFFVVKDRRELEYVRTFEKRAIPEPKRFSPQEAENAFDILWRSYQREYAMFVLRPDVDWDRIRLQYRPQALQCRTVDDFARVCAEMLSHLRDLHIWIRVNDNNVPVFNRPRERNSNPRAFRKILGEVNRLGNRIEWAKTTDNIGFVAIHSLGGERLYGQFNIVLDKLRDTRGLIIDLRLNGGGDEGLGRRIAGRFLDKEAVYSYSRYRNGSAPTDLTDKIPRSFAPLGPWRYDRPAIVLIGQRCMSSCESFIAMLSQCPQVTTMGDSTCGSSGNPRIINLFDNMTVSLPRWIDLLPDGKPLDERGITPDIFFKAEADAFSGDRDDLLSEALNRLKKILFRIERYGDRHHRLQMEKY